MCRDVGIVDGGLVRWCVGGLAGVKGKWGGLWDEAE